jgi:hypothetical protein
MSSRLLLFLEKEALYLVGFTLSINLIFFSELRKPKLGDLLSLNLNVLPILSSDEAGSAAALTACKSDVDV